MIRLHRRRVTADQARACKRGKFEHRGRAHAAASVQKTMQAGEVVRRCAIRHDLQRRIVRVDASVAVARVGIQCRCMLEGMKLTQRADHRLEEQAARDPRHQKQAKDVEVAAGEGHVAAGYRLARRIAKQMPRGEGRRDKRGIEAAVKPPSGLSGKLPGRPVSEAPESACC